MNVERQCTGPEASTRYKVAMVALTSSYYQIALFRELAANPRFDLMVYFCSGEAMEGKDLRQMFNTKGKWGGEDGLLDGCPHKLLRNYSPRPSYLQPYYGLMNFGIWREIRDNRPDLVILMGWNNPTWWVASLACLLSGIPFFYMSDTNIQGESAKRRARGWLKNALVAKVHFRLASGFLCSGLANNRFYRHYGVPENKLIPFAYSWGYGAYLQRSEELERQKDALRVRLGIPTGSRVILFCGRFVKQKNLPNLLAAYDQIDAPEKALILVGEGELGEELRTLVAEHNISSAQFFGFQNRSEIANFYAASDFLVLASSQETWGLVVNEAMCFGLPIIISDQVGSVDDLVRDGQNGFVFHNNDENGLTQALKQALELPEDERLKMGRRSREMIADWSDRDLAQPLLEWLDSQSKNRAGQSKAKKPEDGQPEVLSFIAHYLPGYKAGGPVRALANLVEEVGGECSFKIVTTDRDEGDNEPYQRVLRDRWIPVGKAEVRYLSPPNLSFKMIRRLLIENSYNVVHLTGLFSTTFSAKILLLRRLGLAGSKTVIIAPRGELSGGALKIKSIKKKVYLKVCKWVGLYRDVEWHASTHHEKQDIKRMFGANAKVLVAGDMPTNSVPVSEQPLKTAKGPKCSGTLRVVFLSRISRIKNLHGALEMLRRLEGTIRFDIYGPVQDRAYWRDCQRQFGMLPEGTSVSYHGAVDPQEVAGIFSQHDLFLFPTDSESFGHVVLESLAAGCPVLVSDRTPWTDLEENRAGWVVPHHDTSRFQELLQTVIDMGPAEHERLSTGALEYAAQVRRDYAVGDANRRLLGLEKTARP